MTLRLYDARRGGLYPFAPIGDQPRVGLYVCGVTPYDTGHLGHAFTYVSFDVLHRYLEYLGYDVEYVQNLTDVDDDMLRKARETGEDYLALGNRHVTTFLTEMAALNWLPPDHYPRATQHIPEMLTLIRKLVAKGLAYAAEGNVYFSVAADPGYGQLSKLSREEMLPLANERGNIPDMPGKRDPLDFVLWQRSLPDEPAWESPWGPGRPGWHIECSAMSMAYLGTRFELHGGGADLLFPHHESELAQSEGATGHRPFVGWWAHVGMLSYEGDKMSKSLGNLVLVSRLREQGVDPMAVRLAILAHHYREDWEWTDAGLEHAVARLERWRTALSGNGGPDATSTIEAIRTALADDLDAPAALRAVDTWADAALSVGGDDDGAPGLVARALDALVGVRI